MCTDLHARGLYEKFADNPYLPEFYKNPEKNAFPLEVSFLAERFRQIQDMFENPDLFRPIVISDFIFQKSLIFARFTLAEPEFQVFEKVFRLLHQTAPRPDVLIYLHRDLDSLLVNIKKRGRPYELGIAPEYLQKVSDSYTEYFKEVRHYPVLMIQADHFDFLNNMEERSKLIDFVKLSNLKNGLNFYGEW
ncbi:MAG: deoxynucleoside kinase [Flavobacteriales bacterium]|nr:deoxynucleoside kinase [Flavobacteriales bacterium]